MTIDPRLKAEALAALNAVEVKELSEGAQKGAYLVNAGGAGLVMKIASVRDDPDALRRAEREVDLLARVDSSSVVSLASELIRLGDPPEGVAWLEEHLEGVDLRERLGTHWAEPDVIRLGVDLSRGLAALHDEGYVHRDLSPGNVRCLSDGRYVVMDPGFARHPARSILTLGGQPGTPGYASPEHLNSHSGAPTAASDVFCIGILMFACLSAELPIPVGPGGADYAGRLRQVRRPDVRTLRPETTEKFAVIIDRCLHPQSARRYRNGAALLNELEQLV